MRGVIATASILILASCSAASREPLHPAVSAGAAMTDDQRLSFFAGFDDDSFRALAERAFRDGVAEAEDLLFAVIWNWHPDLPDKAERRRKARLLFPPLAGHPDPRVRAGAWRLGRFLYQEPETAAAWSAALIPALRDPDPDVRLAAVRTATDFHRGWTGGCVVEEKKTSFTLRPHAARLAERLSEEPDRRVRLALLWALALQGRRLVLPAFVRFFTEADRRDEIEEVSGPVRTLCTSPEEGVDPFKPQRAEDPEATWARLRTFADSLRETDAARRNGLVLILFLASDSARSLNGDRAVLGRVVEWLEREPDVVREEDLLQVLGHWRVMEPRDLVHQPHDAVRRSNLPELLKKLKETLSALP